MPNTLIHIIFSSIICVILYQLNILQLNIIIITQILLGTIIIDLDHIIRTLKTGKSLFVKEYGLNKLAFHGWWSWIIIFILLFTPLIYFSIAWAFHIILDGTMVHLGLSHWFITKR